MIRYPEDINAEILSLSHEFAKNVDDSINALSSHEQLQAIHNYVYTHCSARTREFLDDVEKIKEKAKKHNIMAG